MAHVAEYQLTDEPQVIAENDDVATSTYVVENTTALATGEFLGEDNTLGEGVGIAANDKVSFTLASGEAIYAAAPAADAVTLRVLEFKSGD